MNYSEREWIKEKRRADTLQADLDRVDDLHAAECEVYEARIKELENMLKAIFALTDSDDQTIADELIYMADDIENLLEKTK